MTDPQTYRYTVTATGPDGQPVALTIGPTEGALRYSEYWTGPSPWWKRARRKMWRKHG